MSTRLTATQQIELNTIMEDGAGMADAAACMGVSIDVVSAFLKRAKQLAPEFEDPTSFPVITQKLIDACQPKGVPFHNIEFFKLLELDPQADHNWNSTLLLSAIPLVIYKKLVAMAKSLGRDPGPMIRLNQLTFAKRYELYREANPTIVAVDDY